MILICFLNKQQTQKLMETKVKEGPSTFLQPNNSISCHFKTKDTKNNLELHIV